MACVSVLVSGVDDCFKLVKDFPKANEKQFHKMWWDIFLGGDVSKSPPYDFGVEVIGGYLSVLYGFDIFDIYTPVTIKGIVNGAKIWDSLMPLDAENGAEVFFGYIDSRSSLHLIGPSGFLFDKISSALKRCYHEVMVGDGHIDGSLRDLNACAKAWGGNSF